jgi:hypothetical protein
MSAVFYRNITAGLGVLCVILALVLVFEISSLNSQLSEVKDIASLKTSYVLYDQKILNQAPNESNELDFSTNYAGYVTILVVSTTDKNFVQLSYNSHGVVFDSGRVNASSISTISFPVLPGSVTVHVGNLDPVNGATELVTITIFY